MNASEQAGPAFPSLVQVALNLLEQKSPQEHDQLVDRLIGERLREQGLLPTDPAAEQAEWDSFRENIDTDLTNSLNRQIERTAPAGFASASADLRGKFEQAVHKQIQKWAKNDPNLIAAFDNLRGRVTRRARIGIANALEAKARAVLPAAMKQVLRQPEYAALHKVAVNPAKVEEVLTPGSEAVNRMDDRAIMYWTGKIGPRSITPRKQKVSVDEAKHMPFSRLLDDAIEVQR
jgi:hypothetical protein